MRNLLMQLIVMFFNDDPFHGEDSPSNGHHLQNRTMVSLRAKKYSELTDCSTGSSKPGRIPADAP